MHTFKNVTFSSNIINTLIKHHFRLEKDILELVFILGKLFQLKTSLICIFSFAEKRFNH